MPPSRGRFFRALEFSLAELVFDFRLGSRHAGPGCAVRAGAAGPLRGFCRAMAAVARAAAHAQHAGGDGVGPGAAARQRAAAAGQGRAFAGHAVRRAGHTAAAAAVGHPDPEPGHRLHHLPRGPRDQRPAQCHERGARPQGRAQGHAGALDQELCAAGQAAGVPDRHRAHRRHPGGPLAAAAAVRPGRGLGRADADLQGHHHVLRGRRAAGLQRHAARGRLDRDAPGRRRRLRDRHRAAHGQGAELGQDHHHHSDLAADERQLQELARHVRVGRAPHPPLAAHRRPHHPPADGRAAAEIVIARAPQGLLEQ
ncbi:hypothetical protein COLO4_01402 [Corchorus olitorius]|uniref:Uncharacterized protein n=1 Tax=Corchorus olitorius TaxID=93759 RepID=A0A1R3L2Q5_9ROSI|nr:hypothetical protein COLO4_01402 [Corchorus olitorius]